MIGNGVATSRNKKEGEHDLAYNFYFHFLS